MPFRPPVPITRTLRPALVTGVLALLCACAAGSEPPKITLMRTPNGGIQPQATVDTTGTVHLVYFKGDPKNGDIFYVHQESAEGFSEPVRVNNQPGSAMAIGTIRGAQMALGRRGRVHVAWNGSKPSDTHRGVPMLYARLNDVGTAFEPERDLITYATGLDGGGSVAADGQGNVYVVWHASKPGGAEDETGRAVFVARSDDDGRTFAREKLAIQTPTGACGCCGLRAFADSRGDVLVLYRTATELVNRDETLLLSHDHGSDFEVAGAHAWKLLSCPMSSASLTESGVGVLAAWETAGNVYFARVNPGTSKLSEPRSPPGDGARKHPVAVANNRGDVLVAWTEDTGWQRGGAVAWQLFNADGQPTSSAHRAEGVPTWSLVSAVPRPDGSFIIFY